ncbi:MAG: MotA/TolQ/ExbB proton channel family protein [Pseudomonadota bacterium]|nr:MotA/TolQ/ExbB proton channel family protein [Pseudomonadota bacterium]MDE3036831.1 MotA/TolQ/ExbB proton channel family protein [Pseudomonadota bacterium]
MERVVQSVSLATIAGTVFGFCLILGAIAHGTDNYLSFLSVEGFLIVIGGTIANAFMSYQSNYVMLAFGAMWHMAKKPKATREGLNAEIMRLIKWAYLVHSKGLQGLEGEGGAKIKEPLLRYGVDLVVTGYQPEVIRKMMNTAVEADFERSITPVTVLRNMASTSPAFGMVGTLVGMVIMLQNIQGDMSRIGTGLAVALLATLYGIIMARLFCLPAADKLMQKEEIMRFRNYMMTEGLVLLAEKQSPRYMQDKLNSFLDPAIHFDIDEQLKKPAAEIKDVAFKAQEAAKPA